MKRIILCWVSFTLLYSLTTFSQNDHIKDADNDTRIDVEKHPDEDFIRFTLNGSENLILTEQALNFKSPGKSLFIGWAAGGNDDGSNNENTFLGYDAGRLNSWGHGNSFIGTYAGRSNKTGNSNTFLGTKAGSLNKTGSLNTFIGRETGYKNTTGDANTFVGVRAGYHNTTGASNTIVGEYAGYHNNGTFNTFLGRQAGYNNSGGNRNTFLGMHAGQENTSAHDNAFVGYFAGLNNTTGTRNSFLGMGAGKENRDGDDNTYIGVEAGKNNAEGKGNTFVGSKSGTNSKSNANTFIGFETGTSNADGYENVFIGEMAGRFATGSGNVFIGHNAGYDELGNDQLFIDNSGTETPLIWGDFKSNRAGINRVATTNTLEVGGNASKATPGDWLGNSDARLKKNIKALDSKNTLHQILKMQGITYEWKKDRETIRPKGTQYGFVAQDLQKVYPELVSEDAQGYLQTAYGTYDPMFVEGFKAMYQMVEDLKLEVDSLKKALYLMEENAKNTLDETIIIEQIQKKPPASLNIFPNPASDILYIEIDKNQEIKQLSILDISGKVIYSESIQDENIWLLNLDLGSLNLNTGSYFLEIKLGNEEIFSKKLMVH